MNQNSQHILDSSDYQKSDPTLEKTYFWTSSSPTSVKFSIETLIEQIQSVTTDKHAFESRITSKLKAAFELFGGSRLTQKYQKQFSHWLLLHQSKVFEWDLHGWNQRCIYLKTRVRRATYIKIDNIFWKLWIIQLLMQGTESTIFQVNGSPQVGIFRLRSCCNEWRNYSGRKERFDIGGSKKIIRTFLH